MCFENVEGVTEAHAELLPMKDLEYRGETESEEREVAI